ncbi:hypothetical protein [Arthrobacter halodurans]|uniref:hypothetical protein n=1 Tax=Arthrobacter halodurans TaxID=516699 RepID=UPI00403AAA42
MAALCTAALVALGTTIGASPALAFGDHKGVTSEGLSPGSSSSFLHGPIIDDINDAHAWMDNNEGLPPRNVSKDEYHFDDCEFDKSVSTINSRYSSVMTFLQQRRVFHATNEFGKILHTAQDLYSHANWVELGYPRDPRRPEKPEASDLVSFSGTKSAVDSSWTVPKGGSIVASDIILANDDWSPPLGWRIKKHGAGDFQSVLYNSTGVRQGRLLETGKGFLDGECSIPTAGYGGFTHEELNKDSPTNAKYKKARALAELQTANEWCRLVAKAGRADRDGLLLAMLVRPGANPHPANTRCRPVPDFNDAFHHRVTVAVESVQIRNDGDDSGSGEIQLSAAFYDNPQAFHKSVHKENRGGPMSLNTGALVPTKQLPEPMTMCVQRGTSVNWALHGWDNDEIGSEPNSNLFDDKGRFADSLLTGGRAKFSSEASGSLPLAWQDFNVRIRITQGGRC